jgi:hypothetical protein
MDTRGQPNFGRESNAAAGDAGTIGLFDSNLQVRRIDRVAHFVAQFGEKFCDEIISGETVAVLRLEELFPDHPLRVDKEEPRTRHPEELPNGFRVQYLIIPNDLRLGIGEQRNIDFLPIRKIFQDLYAVVADPYDFESLLLESSFCVLQLDQLPFAVWSPIGGTEEENDRSFGPSDRREALLPAKLIASGKRRSFLADVQSDRRKQFKGGHLDSVATEIACDRNAVSQMSDGLVRRIEHINLPDRVVIEHEL